MRSLVSLVGVLVAFGSSACGTVVLVEDGDDGEDGTSGGAGGSGGSSSQVGQGSTTTGQGNGSSTSAGGPTNPIECPATAPGAYEECATADLDCSYLEEQGCTVAYTCVITEDCYSGTGGYDGGYGGYGDDDDGGYGGYGDCYEYSAWVPTAGSCNPAAVACEVAQTGDVCALPGDYCGSSLECSFEDKWCGDDHRWVVSIYEDECCYDECYCDPYYCPEVLPAEGSYCDPCWDATDCAYLVESECGLLDAYASCNPDTFAWDVTDPCEP